MNRRRFLRVPVQVWVEQWTDRETYHQQSSNLSLGGIYLDRTVPHPEGTLVNLRFTLPGEERPIVCKGRIVYPRGAEDDFGMGLEFVDLPAAEEDHLAEFLKGELRRLPEDLRRSLIAGFGSDGLVFEASSKRGRAGAARPSPDAVADGRAASGTRGTGKAGSGERVFRKGKGSRRSD